jgi:hypothetical protein
MILPEERARLAEILESFMAGALSLARYSYRISDCVDSKDRGVAQIAEALFGIDEFDFFSHLHDWKDVDQAYQQLVKRCWRFLRMDLEFEWPKPREWLFFALFIGKALMASSIFILALLAVLFICAAVFGKIYLAIPLLVLCAIWIAGAVFGIKVLNRREKQARERYQATGDWDLWPFLRRTDYERALGEHTSAGT